MRSQSWVAVAASCALAVGVCYADRAVMSVASVAMRDEFAWSSLEQGAVMSAFYYGYCATMTAGGRAADVRGAKGVMAIGAATWSAATCATPAAAARGFIWLLISRAVMGAGEGVCFPAAHVAIARVVPQERRSTAIAGVTAASYVGAAFAFAFAPGIIERFGWEYAFYAFGASMVLWVPTWIPLDLRARDAIAAREGEGEGENDEERRRLTADEAESRTFKDVEMRTFTAEDAEKANVSAKTVEGQRINAMDVEMDVFNVDDIEERRLSTAEATTTTTTVDVVEPSGMAIWLEFIKRREVKAICVAQFAQSFGMYGLLSWLPTYFHDAQGVELGNLPAFTFLPYILQGGVGFGVGVLADELINNRAVPTKRVRQWSQGIGMVGPAIALVVAASPLCDHDAVAAAIAVDCGLALSALTLAGVSVSHLDIAPRHAGLVFATGNTCSTLAGIVGVPLIGAVLDASHQSWPLVFALLASVYVLGAGYWIYNLGVDVIDDDVRIACVLSS